MLVNSDRANKLLRNIQSLNLAETTLDQATRCNGQLKAPSKMSSKRERLAMEFADRTGEEIQKMYLKGNKKYVVRGIIKALIPYRLKVVARSFRK